MTLINNGLSEICILSVFAFKRDCANVQRRLSCSLIPLSTYGD